MAFAVCQELVNAAWRRRMIAPKTQFVIITAETEGRMVMQRGVVSNLLQNNILFGEILKGMTDLPENISFFLYFLQL